MHPNDKTSQNIPSGPPPDQLPRPRMQRMSDIRPAVRPQAPGATQLPTPGHLPLTKDPVVPRTPVATVEEAAAAPVEIAQPPEKKKRSKLKITLGIIVGLIILAITVVGMAFYWYQQQLSPVNTTDSQRIRVVVESGSTPNSIAKELKQKGLIRDENAFLIYTQIAKVRDDLKAGTYNLKPSESLPEIINHLVGGKQDEITLTFLPGDTLANHRKRFISAGYTTQEVDIAFAKNYNRPLFASKPAGADLEGYIYGETYNFLSSASVEDILNRTFDEFEKVIKANNLVANFQKQGLSLYEGITLASIVQREVPTAGDQKAVASVFYNRLEAGMTLGSDVTYQYIADKTGVARDPGLDSPYNTRRYKGLTPGPIASPGLSALQAVAAPASSDYIFFLSGDDDKTYFGRTDAEHQRNIVEHCQKKCQIL